MHDYKTKIDGEVVYQSDIHTSWEQVYRCDACKGEMLPVDIVSFGLNILDAKALDTTMWYDIHETCLPLMLKKIREARRDKS